MTFTVFTLDGRASVVEGEDASAFVVIWQAALRDPERVWPHAYLEGEEGDSAVHFNPMTITAVAVKISE